MFHLTFRSQNDLTLFPEPARQRLALRVIARIAGRVLVAFSLADNHFHLVTIGDRAQAGRIAQRVACGLAGVCLAPLSPARYTAIRDRSHLVNTVRYLLRQPSHHGLDCHPALWRGSCLHDLIGARIISGLGLKLVDELPRLDELALLDAAGLGGSCVRPATRDEICAIDLSGLFVASAEAGCADPPLTDNRAVTTQARAVFARVAVGAGHSGREVRDALGITRRSLNRLLRRPPAPALEAAVAKQVGLRRRVLNQG